MEHAMVKQDAAFIELITASGPGLVAIVRGADKRVLFVNSFFEYELGCSNDEVTSEEVYFTDFIDEYQHDRLRYHMLSVKDVYDKSTAYIIYKIRRRDTGQVKSYYVFIAPVPESDGYQDMYKLVMMPDLSQWKMPFTSFESRELFLEHFQSETFGTFEYLIDKDKTYWSEGIYEIYEVSPGQKNITRDFASSFIHHDDKLRIRHMAKEAMKTGGPIDMEFRIVTGDGHVKVIHSLGKVVLDAAGHPVKLVGSLRDVTAQRSIENDLKQKVEELYHSNQELEEFAYVASHDLQEPLRKITTFSSRLMERYKDVLTGEGEMYLTRMNASAENMRALINDLLEFSRISNTQQPFAPTDLNLVLKMVKGDLELIIEETGAVITCDKLPVIDAVQSHIKQLFTNIIGNAIKFRKPDIAPRIEISAVETDGAVLKKFSLPLNRGRYYTIVISDNGIGFEKEYAQKIFNVFQRLHGKAEYPGSGIGLAICKKIIEYHHGVIYAEGRPGEGSSFTFIVPENK